MPVNYIIQADIVDLRTDDPKPEDIFLVDSNIWYWLTYTRASLSTRPPRTYQINDYPAYISKALFVKSNLFSCGLSLAELAHLIERTEREIFVRSNGYVAAKEFRHNYLIERKNTVDEIHAAWEQIKIMAQNVDARIDHTVINTALSRLSAQPLDGYDLFILEAISNAGIMKVITDDGDYATVPGIHVFTANQNVLAAAQSQGRLITR